MSERDTEIERDKASVVSMVAISFLYLSAKTTLDFQQKTKACNFKQQNYLGGSWKYLWSKTEKSHFESVIMYCSVSSANDKQ